MAIARIQELTEYDTKGRLNSYPTQSDTTNPKHQELDVVHTQNIVIALKKK